MFPTWASFDTLAIIGVVIALGGTYAWDAKDKILALTSRFSTPTPPPLPASHSQDEALDAHQVLDAYLKDCPKAQASLDELWMLLRNKGKQ